MAMPISTDGKTKNLKVNQEKERLRGKGGSRPPELLQGPLDMMILTTVSHGANHGFGIARRIRQVSAQVLRVEEGSLYPALHRLEKRGFLTSVWNRSESNRRAKYYRLTARGKARLAEDTEIWGRLAGAVERVMSARVGDEVPA